MQVTRGLLVIGAMTLLSPAPVDAKSKTVVYYEVPANSEVRSGPGMEYPVLYKIKGFGTVKRAGTYKLNGKTFSGGGVEGRPRCKSGWCEVAWYGKAGFVPQSWLQRKIFKDDGKDDCDLAFDDCW